MPKTLYLVRHAKSSWDDPALGDRDRPLSQRGLNSAPDMGKRLAAQGHKPDLIISSPAKRAFTTAKKIAKETGYREAKIVTDERMYFSGTRSMLDLLEGLDDKHKKVMIVGHNPALTSLLNILCDSPIENMPTCAVAVVGFEMKSWSELSISNGELLAYDFPKGPGSFSD
jgi:phosphohistidine phosphatase